MSVQASKQVSAGLKLSATIHSSTFMDGLIEVRSGRVMRTQINVPRDNIELFDIQSNIFLVHNEDEQVPAMVSNNDAARNSHCFGSELIGMELCGEMVVPSGRKGMPLFPLNGGAAFKAYLHKTDPTMNQYNFEVRTNYEDGKNEGTIKFNTPGSTVDREISTGFNVNTEDQTFLLFGRTPATKINVSGKRVSNEVDNRLTFGVSLNDVEKFSVDASLGMDGVAKNGIRYMPSLFVRGPNAIKLMTLKGHGSVRPGQKYSGELVLEDIVEKAIVLKSDVTIGDRKEVQLSLTSSAVDFSASGFLNKRNSAYTVKGNVEYRIMDNRRVKMDVTGKFRDQSANSLVKYSGTASVQNSVYPEYSTNIMFETQLTNGHIENTLEINLGQGKKNNLQKITIQKILRWEGSLPENKVEAKLSMKYPQKNIDYMLTVEHQNTAVLCKDKMTLRYAPEREITAAFSANVDGNPNVNFQLDNAYSERVMDVECTLKKMDRDAREYQLSMNANWLKKNSLKASMSLSDRSDSVQNNYAVKSELTLPKSRQPMVFEGDVIYSTGHYVANAEMNIGSGIMGGKVEYTKTSSLGHRLSAIARTPSQTYSAEGTIEGSQEQLAIKANLQGQRRITGSIDVRNSAKVKTCSVNLMWDADRDTDKRFGLESELKCSGNKHQGKASISYPGRTISGSFDGSMEGQLSRSLKASGNVEFEYQTGSKLRLELNANTMNKDSGASFMGDAKLTTPFKGVENMALSVHQTVSSREFKNEIIAQYQPNRKISLVTDCKHQLDSNTLIIDMNTRLTTPFRGYESMTGQALLKMTANDVSSSIAARWENNVFEIAASGSSDPMNVMVNITTPSTTLSQASASFALDRPSKNNHFKIDSDVTWNARNQINVALEGRSSMASKKRSCFVHVLMTSTIRNYEKMSSRINYNHADKDFKIESDFSLNKNKMNLGVSTANRNSRSNTDMEGRIYYTSTLKNFRNGEIKGIFNKNSNKLSYSLNAKLPFDGAVNLQLVSTETSSDNKDLSFSYNAANIYGMTNPASATFTIKIDGQRLVSNAQMTIGESISRADLTASAIFGSENHIIQTRLNINAPDFFDSEEMVFSFDHQRKQMHFTTDCSVSAMRNEIRANHELNINDATNFETKLNVYTPFRKYRTVVVSLFQSNNAGLVKHTSNVDIAGKKIIAINAEFGLQQRRQSTIILTCKLNAQTTFYPNRLNVDAKHEMSMERMAHHPRLNVEWSHGKSLSFEGKFTPMDDSPVIEARLSSTLPSLEILAFTAKLNNENNQKCTVGSFRWTLDKEVTMRGCLDTNNVELSVTTPFDGFETVNLRGDMNVAQTEKSTKFSVEYGRNRITFNGKYNILRRGSELTMQYSTPFNGYTSGSFRGKYLGRLNDFTADVSCEYANSQKMSISVVHKFNNEKLNSKVIITTPFRGYRTMSTNFETDFSSSRKMASMSAELESKAISTNGIFENDFPRSLFTSFEMTSPIKGLEQLKLNGDFRKTDGNVNIITSFQVGRNNNIRANIVFENDLPRLVMTKMELSSTFKNFEDIKLNGNYKKTSAGCILNSNFEFGNSKSLNTEVVLENEYPRAMLASFELTTTLRDLENINTMVKFNGNGKLNGGNIIASFQMGKNTNLRSNIVLENELPRSLRSSFEFTSSFKNIENLQMNVNYFNNNAGGRVEGVFEYGKKQIINVVSVLENDLPRTLKASFELRSPFENFKTIRLNGNYQKTNSGRNIATSFQGAEDQTFTLNAELTENIIEINIDTPYSPIRNVKLNGMIGDENIRTTVEWESPSNKIDMNLRLKKSANQLEASFELTTPFRNFRKLSGSTELSKFDREWRHTKGMVKLSTPFEIVRSFNMEGEAKLFPGNYQIDVSVMPNENSQRRVISAFARRLEGLSEFQVNFDQYSITGNFKGNGYKMMDAMLKMISENEHSISITSRVDETGLFNGDVRMVSSFLPSNEMGVSVNMDVRDTRKMSADLSTDYNRKTHKTSGSLKIVKFGFDGEIKIQTPMIPSGDASLSMSYNNKRNKITGQSSINYNNQIHATEFAYDSSDSRQIMASGEIRCPMISSGTVRIEGKFSVPQENALETVLNVIVGAETHSCKTRYFLNKSSSMKTEASFALESSLLPSNSFVISANLEVESFKTVEGSLTVNGIGNGESRLYVNLRSDQFRSIDGFATLNLPAGPLRMFRGELKVKTDGTLRNADISLDVQTSVRDFKRVSTSFKTKTSADVVDISANLRLPGMDNIAFLATVHKNQEMTRLTPRITVTLPSNKYVFFGNMENDGTNIIWSVGFEMDSRRTELSYELKSGEVQITLVTPFKNYERYSIICSYKDEKSKKAIRMVLEDPTNRKIVIQTSGMYHSIINFNFEMDLKTPFEMLLDNNIRFRHQFRRGRMLTSFQHLSTNSRKLSFTMEHQASPSNYNGNFQLSTPFDSLSSSKITYSYVSSSGNGKINIQSELNGRSILQFDVNNEAEETRVGLSLPTMPYTLKCSMKQGVTNEFSITSMNKGRTMGFTGVYQNTDSVLSHGAKVIWDEMENSVVSYEWRSSSRRNGVKELYGRFNFPLRSFEIKTEHEPTSTGRIIKCDLFWDAARNPSKHVKLALEHADTSGSRTVGHKVQLTFSYPELNKEIVAKTEFNYSPKEILARAEMEFSRNSQQNLLVELRAQDISESRKDSKYQLSIFGRHPASRVDVKINADIANNAQEASSGMKVVFLGRDGREKIQELTAKIQKLKQKIEMMARSNDDTMELNGRYFNRDRMMTIEVDTKMNDMSVARGNIRYNEGERKVDLTMSHSDESIHVRASVLPGDMFHMEVSHSASGQPKVSDALFHLSLKESRLLESRLKYRPEFLGESQNRLQMAYDTTNNKMMEVLDLSYRQTSYEMNEAARRLNRAITPELELLKDSLSTEMSKLSEDYSIFERKMRIMYHHNEFYMKTILETSYGVVEEMIDIGYEMVATASKMVSFAYDCINNACSTIHEFACKTVKSMKMMYENTLNSVYQSIEEFNERMDEFMLDVFGYFITKAMDFGDMMDSYTMELDAFIDRLSKRWSPLFESISDVMSKAIRYIEEHADSMCQNRACQYIRTMIIDMKTYLNKMSYDVVSENVNNYYNQMGEMIEHANEYAETAYKYIQDNAQFNCINEITARSFDQLRQTAYHLGLDTLALNIMEEIYSKSMQAVYSTIRLAVQDVSEMRNNIRYVFEPASGLMEIEMNLPNTKFNLNDLNEIVNNPNLDRLAQMKDQFFDFDTNSMWDMYYQYKRYMDPYYWIPPYTGHAMLAGNQHFVTFDNFHFDYAGECSYLLARDFVDGNFSASVTYVQDENRKAVRKSLVVFSNNVKVEISNDHKITMNDVKVELPQELTPGGVTMALEDGIVIVSDPRRGMTIKCNFVHDICTMDISGFYFGKTGGLFGTFNYEPHMDMTTRDNKMVSNMEEFASSWKVGGSSCKSDNKAVQTSNDMTANEKCKELFQSNNSPMRSCFKLLNPEPFMRMCVNDLSNVRNSEQSVKSCTATAAYVEKCRQEGVEIRMPNQCVRCEKHDNQMMEGGEMAKITNTPSSSQASDVVFIVEQKSCNTDIPQMLNRLAAALEEGLRKEGYRKIRFSVVGFGGEGVHEAPHVVSIEGKVFGTSRSISTALENLPISKNMENSNVFMALRFAAGLPFLAGATKTFVVAKCSSCKAQDMKADYSEMLRTMLDGEINLHMLMDLQLETRSLNKAAKAKRVVGLDKNYAYTLKDMTGNELGGDRDLLAQLRVPKDLCVPLALEINGSVFSTAKLIEMKKNSYKKTQEILAKRVIKTAIPTECQICECLQTSSGIGKSVCQRCVSPVVDSMLSDDTMMVFYNKDSRYADNEDSGIEDDDYVEKTSPAKPKVKSLRKKNKGKN